MLSDVVFCLISADGHKQAYLGQGEKIMGRQVKPNREETEFVFGLMVDGLDDKQIIEEYRRLDEDGDLIFPLRKDIRIIRELREQFNAARTIIEPHLRQKLDPAVQKARESHLAEIEELITKLKASFLVAPMEQMSNDGIESNPLFNALQDHIPYDSFWGNYNTWKRERKELAEIYFKIKVEIEEEIKGWNCVNSITKDAAYPILKKMADMALSIGVGTKPTYNIYVPYKDTIERIEENFGIASVDGQDVAEVNDKSSTFREAYANLSSTILQKSKAIRMRTLVFEITKLQEKLNHQLQQELLSRAYILRFCKFCQVKSEMN